MRYCGQVNSNNTQNSITESKLKACGRDRDNELMERVCVDVKEPEGTGIHEFNPGNVTNVIIACYWCSFHKFLYIYQKMK